MKSNLKTGIFSRGIKLASLGIRVGSTLYKNKLSTFLDIKNLKNESVLKQVAEMLQVDTTQLRGAALKLGQQLSVFGEHFFSPEVNEILKTLQSLAEPVAWEVIERQLIKELGSDYAARLAVEPKPIACASIGQVHRASDRQGNKLCLKIQYPGIHKTVKSDLMILKILLKFSNLLPVDVPVDVIMQEVKSMLLREVDYEQEQKFSNLFSEHLKGQPFNIPKIRSDLSTARVLTMSYMEGLRFDDQKVQSLSQEERNKIGRALLDLMFREIFEFRVVQTDAHLGNFLYDEKCKTITLLDFGACRTFSLDFIDKYRSLVTATLREDLDGFDKACIRLKLYDQSRSDSLVEDLFKISKFANEPFKGKSFDFSDDNLPQRGLSELVKFSLRHELKSPPREFIFLNRKVAGTYTLLKILRANFDATSLVDKHILGRAKGVDL